MAWRCSTRRKILIYTQAVACLSSSLSDPRRYMKHFQRRYGTLAGGVPVARTSSRSKPTRSSALLGAIGSSGNSAALGDLHGRGVVGVDVLDVPQTTSHHKLHVAGEGAHGSQFEFPMAALGDVHDRGAFVQDPAPGVVYGCTVAAVAAFGSVATQPTAPRPSSAAAAYVSVTGRTPSGGRVTRTNRRRVLTLLM